MTPILAVEDLSAGYGASDVLRDLSLSVAEGTIAAILGPNGAGKTTLLRAISGTIRRRGRISLGGVSLAALPAHRIASKGLAHVPQGAGVFARLTVSENLRSGALQRRDHRLVAADRERVLRLFPRLAERLSQPAGVLSGGEQQMLAIGRALMARPRLLMLDEPSFGLASKLAAEVFEALGGLRNEAGLSILVVEQNAALALAIADEVYVMGGGEIRLSGPTAAIRDHSHVRSIYFGGLIE